MIHISPQGNFTTEITAEVDVDGQIKYIKIGMAPGLPNILGLSSGKLKAAFSEPVQRIVRNMLQKNRLKDYTFSSEDLPDKSLFGFEAYTALRDSLDK